MSFPLNSYNNLASAQKAPLAMALGQTESTPKSTSKGAATPQAPVSLPVSSSLQSAPQPFSLPSPPTEDPIIPLKATGLALILGAPIVKGFDLLYKDMGTGYSLIERGLAFLDKALGIKQLGQAIDWVGEQYTKGTGKPLPKRLQAIVDYANPSIDQFLQRKLPGVVLHDHANDYLNLLSHLTTTQASQDGLVSLRQSIASKVKDYADNYNIPLHHYSSDPTHSIGAAEALLDKIKLDIDTYAGWVSDIHSPVAAPLRLQQAQALLNHAEIKALTNGSPQLQNALGSAKTIYDVEGIVTQHLKQTKATITQPLINALVAAKTSETNAFLAYRSQLQQTVLNQFGVTEDALKAAGFTNFDTLKKAPTLRTIRKHYSQSWFSLLFKDKATRQAARRLNQGLAQASLLQRRLAGVAERLTGMSHLFIPMYEVDRVLSTSLKNRKPVVGAVSRFIGGLLNDIRDSFNGAALGAKSAAVHGGGFYKFAMKAFPWVAPIAILKGPIENALKAENGDKIKTFLYDFIAKEIPLMLTFVIGVKYLHEISIIKHLGTFLQFVGRNVGVSPWLKGLGNLLTNKAGFTSASPAFARMAKPFERFNVGRLASRFFAMTGKLPGLGHVTLGGFALMAILPSAIFGSRFEKRFTWLAKHSIGTPESFRQAKAAEKAAENLALKQKLPAAFFNQASLNASPQASPNPFSTSNTSALNAPMAQRPAGVPINQASNPSNNPLANFQQLLQSANGPLTLANGSASLGPNATTHATQELSAAAAARGLENDRQLGNQPAANKPSNKPATTPTIDDSKKNPLEGVMGVSPEASDIIAAGHASDQAAQAMIQQMGLQELVDAHH